jgi:hypothetical protein
MSNDQDNGVIQQRSSIMLAFFTMLYREYCRSRLAEMRKYQLTLKKSGLSRSFFFYGQGCR